MIDGKISEGNTAQGGPEHLLPTLQHIDSVNAGGEAKESLAWDIVTSVQEYPSLQKIVIRSLIEMLGTGERPEDDDRRQAARKLLTSDQFQSLLVKQHGVVYAEYLSVLKKMQREHVTILGPIDAMLEAGRDLAPIFAQREKDARISAIDAAWSEVARHISDSSVLRHVREEQARLGRAIQESSDTPLKEQPEQTISKPISKKEQKKEDAVLRKVIRELLKRAVASLRTDEHMNEEQIRDQLKISRSFYGVLIQELIDEGVVRDARWRTQKNNR